MLTQSLLLSFFALSLITASAADTSSAKQQKESKIRLRGRRQLHDAPPPTGQGFFDEESYIAELAEKLSPYELTTSWDDHANRTQYSLHQFLHLHHMKTGGTSMDGLLHCAMSRIGRDVDSPRMSYMNIHECGLAHYEQCRDGPNPQCRNSINDSAVLSYCAPLKDLTTFGWRKDDGEEEEKPANQTKTHAVTVLRHPVNRVWSMFRFQTKGCYACTELKDVYAAIDSGDYSKIVQGEICKQQLLNHQTRNLVSHWDVSNSTLYNKTLVDEAIHNMKNFFTMVGLTEDMESTAQMVGAIFPWMNETYGDSNTKCPMPHANKSPQNNRCGPGGSHWDLPPHPDEETKKLIISHNQMDVELYEAAVQQFEYQKMALGLGEQTEQ